MFTLQFAALCFSASVAAEPLIPLSDGFYEFRWRDAEFTESPGFPVQVEIDGRTIRIVNRDHRAHVPLGELETATLMWNEKVGKWILGHSPDDSVAASAGGCGDDEPHVIDFERREIWTCEWGPSAQAL